MSALENEDISELSRGLGAQYQDGPLPIGVFRLRVQLDESGLCRAGEFECLLANTLLSVCQLAILLKIGTGRDWLRNENGNDHPLALYIQHLLAQAGECQQAAEQAAKCWKAVWDDQTRTEEDQRYTGVACDGFADSNRERAAPTRILVNPWTRRVIIQTTHAELKARLKQQCRIPGWEVR